MAYKGGGVYSAIKTKISLLGLVTQPLGVYYQLRYEEWVLYLFIDWETFLYECYTKCTPGHFHLTNQTNLTCI